MLFNTTKYVTIKNIEFLVNFDVIARVVGKFIPQNYWEPAEYPEFNDIEIMIYDVSLETGKELKLTEKFEQMLLDRLQDEVEDLCYENYKA